MNSSNDDIYLLSGVGSGASNISRLTAELLIGDGKHLRVLVHHDDGRADGLRALGAEVIAGDLASPRDVDKALDGATRMFFNLSVSSEYLKAAAVVASVAREHSELEHLVNMSQMTVSQMTATSHTESDQQRLHWLVEQVFNWSGLPVTHVRPTVFLDNPIFTIFPRAGILSRHELALPIGDGRTSPIVASDVALAVATALQQPPQESGRVLELTGPEVLTLDDLAAAYSSALGTEIFPIHTSIDEFSRKLHAVPGISPHVIQHLLTIARLHRDGRYDRQTNDFEELTGEKAQPVQSYIALNRVVFTGDDDAL